MSEDSSDDTFRILIATDNHLGVWEKDEIRRDDSFTTFEEVLQIAQQLDADFVLLGGDLFHENKPSMRTLHKCMRIFSQYCLNDRPVSFQMLSDQSILAAGQWNVYSSNVNVGMPVFLVHGNHDDPSGTDNLSAIDLVSAASLVNYFGKVSMSGSNGNKLQLRPLLLQKGLTKLALYGLGWIRDERLARIFNTHQAVEWVRPEESEAHPRDAWFNIMVIHQNRVQHGANPKSCVRNSHLPRWLDFVIWGHEHECLPQPEDAAVPGSSFKVLQAGSTVQTGLMEGEAAPKHCFLLEVNQDQYRLTPHPLTSVRPFLYKQVVLAQELGPSVDAGDADAIASCLERHVEELIAATSRPREAGADGKDAKAAGKLPLVRLRVDHTGFGTIQSQRFGQRFVGKVANPQELLRWTKAARKREAGAKVQDGGDLRGQAGAELQDQLQIGDLIAEQVQDVLDILPKLELSEALHKFVEKDEKGAMREAYERVLRDTQKAALKDLEVVPEGGSKKGDEEVEQFLRSAVVRRREAAESAAAGKKSQCSASWGGLPEASPAAEASDNEADGAAAAGKSRGVGAGKMQQRQKQRGPAASTAARGGKRRQQELEEVEDEEEDEEEEGDDGEAAVAGDGTGEVRDRGQDRHGAQASAAGRNAAPRRKRDRSAEATASQPGSSARAGRRGRAATSQAGRVQSRLDSFLQPSQAGSTATAAPCPRKSARGQASPGQQRQRLGAAAGKRAAATRANDRLRENAASAMLLDDNDDDGVGMDVEPEEEEEDSVFDQAADGNADDDHDDIEADSSEDDLISIVTGSRPAANPKQSKGRLPPRPGGRPSAKGARAAAASEGASQPVQAAMDLDSVINSDDDAPPAGSLSRAHRSYAAPARRRAR